MTRPRLLVLAALVSGAGLLGSSAHGVGSLDRELASAASVAAEAREAAAQQRDRDCPWRKRHESRRKATTTF